ncbi:ANTAR domain-containing protein [Streptomyces sp. NPDC089424]|uniref:ANTAR domain-containing protein n=1 Tax=Streptomyces sp. NPDC089424 TaxID=3365917 RepID=UPI003825EA0F
MIANDGHTERLTVLQQEVRQLRRTLDSRALVDQAVGVVMAVGGLRPDQARAVLEHIARDTGAQLPEVAGSLVRWPTSDELPPGIREALPRAVDQVRHLDEQGGGDRAGTRRSPRGTR